jgi:DNA-binding transcriptional LysR family regulator
MRATFAQLEAFYWVARLGSFRAASQHLNVTQPTLSQRMKELETGIGVSLFHRDTYRPRLTFDGHRILGDVEDMLAIRNRIASRISGAHKLSGRIRMGVAESFATTHFVPFFDAVRRSHPDLEIELRIDYSAKIETMLVARDIDFALITNPSELAHLRVQPLGYIDLVWVCPKTVAAGKPHIEPADLRSTPIITNPPPSNLNSSIWRWFADAGETPRQIMTCGSLEVMRQLATAGIGAALLPAAILRSESEEKGIARPPLPIVPAHVFCATWHRVEEFHGAQQLTAIADATLRETTIMRPYAS